MGDTVLVTGGAGYIGSHVCKALRKRKIPFVVVDNLSTGYRESLKADDVFYRLDLQDTNALTSVFEKHSFDVVMHFAASIRVEESCAKPLQYYDNNTVGTLRLLEMCQFYSIRNFVLSSTAAVYGNVDSNTPLPEDSRLAPENPYGRSKWMDELILRDLCAADKNFKTIVLRYFNVAGADPDLEIGQRGKESTHLIKVACEVATGKRTGMEVFGTDYPTPDGTCIRDYIHVADLASAHVDAVEKIRNNAHGFNVYNCGYGKGYSVKQVLAEIENANSQPLQYSFSGRRAGDVAQLTADSTRIRQELGWKPQYDRLEFICKSALEWEKKIQSS